MPVGEVVGDRIRGAGHWRGLALCCAKALRRGTIDHLPWPGRGRPDQMEVVRRLVLDAGEFGHEDYDRDRWPTWRDWVAGTAQIPSRAIALERLRTSRRRTAQSDNAAIAQDSDLAYNYDYEDDELGSRQDTVFRPGGGSGSDS